MEPLRVILVILICASFGDGSINNIFTIRSVMPQTFSLSSALAESIASGAQIGIDSCQEVFQWNRWNCPESTFSRKHQQSSTKELAFARAIVSAGIVHAVTRNCSRGEIRGCGCNPNFIETGPLVSGLDIDQAEFNKSNIGEIKWNWGGCSDHVEYGSKIAQSILDELEEGNSAQSLISLHNNLVGREIVKNTMVRRCRCHGVSGSCTVQTCWMQVASFARIAHKLKEKYEKAIRIKMDDDMSNTAMASTTTPRLPADTPTGALIYLEQSPDYCKPDSATGWKGTKGRSCSRSRMDYAHVDEKKSCRNVCRACGHRVRKQRRTVSTRCNCSFKWCCEVQCETCVKTVEEYYCV